MSPLGAIVLHEVKRLYKSFLLLGSVAAVAAALIPSLLIVLPLQIRQQEEHRQNAVDLRAQLDRLRSLAGFQLRVETPPPPLAFLNRGLLDELDSRLEFSRLDPPSLRPLAGHGAVIAYLFPSTDVVTLSALLFSLIPLAFGCGVFSGEKERGTLRLALANSVSRSQFLTGKLLGNALGMLAPWSALTLLAAIAAWSSPTLRTSMDASDWLAFGAVFLLIYLYAAVHLQIAFLASALTRRTVDTLLALLFVWLFTQVVVPSVAMEVAQSWKPAPSSSESRHQLENIETQLVLGYARMLERVLEFQEGLSDLAVSRPAREYFHYRKEGVRAFITRDGDFWVNEAPQPALEQIRDSLPELLRRQKLLRRARDELYSRGLRTMREQLSVARAAWPASPGALLKEVTADLVGTGPENALAVHQQLALQTSNFYDRLESSRLFRENFGRRLLPGDETLRFLASEIDALDADASRRAAGWSLALAGTGYLLLLWLLLFAATYFAAVRYDPR